MVLRVKDIVANPTLYIRAAFQGSDLKKKVDWAHVSELTDPTEWLGRGDLLMTTGMGIPHSKTGQVEYVERLHAAGLAGLVIGEDMQAPEDLSALLNTAEKLRFNVLYIAYEVPFSAITKLISNYKKYKDYEENNSIRQIYETARLSIKAADIEVLLERLQRDIKSTIYLIDPQTAKPWMQNLPSLPDQQRVFVANQYQKNKVSVFQKTVFDSQEWVIMNLPTQNEASIVVKKHAWIDYILLSHIATVIGIELERARFEYENALRLGVEAFDDLLMQVLPEVHVLEQLKPFELRLSECRVLAFKVKRPYLNRWNEMMCRHNIRVLFKKKPGKVLALVNDLGVLETIQEIVGYPIGYSSFVGDIRRIPEAVREANLALEFSSEENVLVSYESCAELPFWLPRNLEVARQVFDNVLGELAEYDRVQNTRLVTSLKVYLECNKSWLRASEKLHIHKQSLIYRIKKVEEITNRSLSSMDDMAIFWFALQAGGLIEAV